MDHHLFQPRPRVRRLLKVQITHIHTPQWKKMNPSSLCVNRSVRCQTRAPLYAQSALQMGQVKSQALLMKSLHAGPRNRMLERVRKSRSGLETQARTARTHTAVWGEETFLLNTYLMEMRCSLGGQFMHLCIVFIRQIHVSIRHIRRHCIFQSYCASFSSLTPKLALFISICEVFPPSYAWKSAPTSIFFMNIKLNEY